MLHKSELQDWLNNPVTKAFQKALELEAQASKEDLTDSIDGSDFDAATLHEVVTINKAVRHTYSQFYGQDAKGTIENMMLGYDLLEDEEEKDGSN